LRALERLECEAPRLRAPQHALINQLGAQAGEEELGGKLRTALADRLRITKAEGGRRIDEAEDLAERRALTGEPLAPRLSATAAGQRQGLVGARHVHAGDARRGRLVAEDRRGPRPGAGPRVSRDGRGAKPRRGVSSRLGKRPVVSPEFRT